MSGVVPKYVNMNMRRPAIILYISHYTTLTVRITLHYTYHIKTCVKFTAKIKLRVYENLTLSYQ